MDWNQPLKFTEKKAQDVIKVEGCTNPKISSFIFLKTYLEPTL
jgi:hypothetical protein